MALVVDDAYVTLTPAQLASAGYSGIIGYVSENDLGKNITANQVKQFRAAGLDVGFVYEYYVSSPVLGEHEGILNATVAASQMKKLGVPPGVACYTALDRNFPGTVLPTIARYVYGFNAVMYANNYRSGLYGGYDQLLYMRDNGYSGLLWQTYAWSRGLWLPGLALRQVQNGIMIAGDDVDKDVVMVSDWGQWRAGASPVKPSGRDSVITHWHTVRRGDTGQQVMDAQGLLIAHGLTVSTSPNHPDGFFGPMTEAATRLLQRRFGITDDGAFGPHTLSVALFGMDVA